MKFWKTTLLTVCSFFAITATVLVSSCEKDACTELKCKNGSACTEGFCRCQTGYEGSECETRTISRFIGTYYGYNYCGESTPLLDTVDVYEVASPNVVQFSLRKNYPDERFRGVAEGDAINVADISTGKSVTKTHAEIDQKNITVLIERNFNTEQPSNRSVCKFVGAKK